MIKLLLTLLIIPTIGCSQSKYLVSRDYSNQKIVERIKNENSSVTRSLVYQPVNNLADVTSVLILEKGDKVYYWIITNDSTIKQGSLQSNIIFSYTHFLKTGATRKEDNLEFVSPLMNGDSTANVIYEDKHRRFYFEYGKNVTGYTPDAALEIYRKEWLNIIRFELSSIIEEKKQ